MPCFFIMSSAVNKNFSKKRYTVTWNFQLPPLQSLIFAPDWTILIDTMKIQITINNNNRRIITKFPDKTLFPPFKLLSFVDYPPGCSDIDHTHDHFQSIIVLSGEFRMSSKGADEIILMPGEMIIIPPGKVHSWRSEKKCKTMQLISSPMLMEDYGELSMLWGDVNANWRKVSTNINIIKRIYSKLMSECNACRPADSTMVHLCLIELLCIAFRAFCVESNMVSIKGNGKIVLRNALSYIHSNYRKKITLKELAKNSFLGESRFSQVFRKYTGHSPVNYIIQYRLEKAKTLLAYSHMSVSQVAEHLGFESLHYFSRLFKKHYAHTPSSVRDAGHKS